MKKSILHYSITPSQSFIDIFQDQHFRTRQSRRRKFRGGFSQSKSDYVIPNAASVGSSTAEVIVKPWSRW